MELGGGGKQTYPFWQTGWVGTQGNEKLDLDSIRCFKFEFTIDGSGGVGTTSSGSIVLDGLEVSGGGDLNSVLDLSSWEEKAVHGGIWVNQYYNSNLSESSTKWTFHNDSRAAGAYALNASYLFTAERIMGWLCCYPAHPSWCGVLQPEFSASDFIFEQHRDQGRSCCKKSCAVYLVGFERL